MKDVNFTNNVVFMKGGGLSINNNTKSEIKNVTFKNNEAFLDLKMK